LLDYKNCLSCISNSTCIKCTNNLNLNNNMCCSSSYCLDCTGNPLICIKCSSNYFIYKNDNSCYNKSLIKNCDVIGDNGCISCSIGFYLSSNHLCSI